MVKIQKSKQSNPIKKTETADLNIAYSFKYVIFPPDKFKIDDMDVNYYHSLFNKMKELNRLTCSQFRSQQKQPTKTLRIHRIYWDQTTEPEGFSHLNQQLKEEEAWQFSVTSNKHGRVHGLLIDNVFYVVWFDPNHDLYKKNK